MNLYLPNYLPGENNKAYARRVLRMNIMTLRVLPGEAINEPELSKILQMSRTPVHEAVSALRDEWLVDVLPQKSTRVSKIDPGLVKEGYSVRVLLEAELLRDCSGKIGKNQVQKLLEAIRSMENYRGRIPEEAPKVIYYDDEFHRLMYTFGGRAHTWMAIRGLVSHYDRLRYLDMLDGNMNFDRVVNQHKEFINYLFTGLPSDVDPVEKMREHLAAFRGNLMDKMEAHPDFFTLDVL